MPRPVSEELAEFLNNHRQKNQIPPPEWQDDESAVQWQGDEEVEDQPLTPPE